MKQFLTERIFRFLLLLVFIVGLPATLDAQNNRLQLPQESLKARIERIVAQSDKNIIYDDKAFSNIQVAALNSETNDLNSLLTKTLASTGFGFKTMPDNSIIIKRLTEETNEPTAAPKGRGSLQGSVLDENGEVLIGATISVPGISIGTVTDINGKYKLANLPSGTTDIQISFMSYETILVKNVKIAVNKTTPLDVVLKESSTQLGEVLVTATYNEASATGLYARQKSMVAMSDGVSADMIKKTAYSNVAQVLKKVSGVSVTDGKYVVVRGMSERYNNVQLNGTSLPSTEPNRRNFSFDIIPANLVDNVSITKSFTPDMQGEFAGGMVEINTLAVPKEQFLNLSVGSGGNSNSTGKKFMSNKRFKSDYFLGNSSERDWFNRDWMNDEYDSYLNISTIKPEMAEKAYAMNAKVPNHWGLSTYKARPTQNYALSVGKPFLFGNSNRLGVVLAATYRHEENTETLIEANFRKPDTRSIDGHSYKFMTSIGAVANIGWERPGHKVTFRNLLNNRFTHNNMERLIDSNQDSGLYWENYSSPMRNLLWQTRLDGEHKLFDGKLKLSWFGDYNKLSREQHDDRLMKGNINSTEAPDSTGTIRRTPNLFEGKYHMGWGGAIHSSRFAIGDAHIMYADLQETRKNIGANLEFPFQVKGNLQKLKAGYWGTFRKGHYQQQYIRPQGIDTKGLGGLPLHDFLAPEVMAAGKLYYAHGGKKGNRIDYYKGEQRIHAAYLMGDFSFFKKLHLVGGLRMEKENTEVLTWYRSISAEMESKDSTIVQNNRDWLPSLTAIYNISPNLNARIAYGKTLARPDFREQTRFSYYNVSDRMEYEGRFALKNSYADNYDLRLEWYPEAGEVLSVSFFYKEFKNPVEFLTYNPNMSGNYVASAFNLDEATTQGVEINLRKSFGFISPLLKELYLTANTTLLKGDVKYNQQKLSSKSIGLDPNTVVGLDRSRPLAGLAPYTVNAELAYQGKYVGAAINYGTHGKRVVLAAPVEFDDEYEAPRNVLDLQLSCRLLKNKLEIKANLSDILNEPFTTYVNTSGKGVDNTDDMSYNKGKDIIRTQITKGVGYSLSVNYSF